MLIGERFVHFHVSLLIFRLNKTNSLRVYHDALSLSLFWFSNLDNCFTFLIRLEFYFLTFDLFAYHCELHHVEI